MRKKAGNTGCRLSVLMPAVFIAVLLLLTGCDDGVVTGKFKENIPPTLDFTFGPVEGDSIQYHVHFYWSANDPDGIVDHFEVALVDGHPTGFDPADTTGADKWTRTIATDTLIMARADSFGNTVNINTATYAVYEKVHTFFIRAVDDKGAASQTIYRSFTAWTLAPQVVITDPVNVNPDQGIQRLSPVTRFRWYGKDPIDSPWNYQDVDSIRYLCTNFSSNVMDDLNKNPEKFDMLWSPWISRYAPGDSGISTIIGDDEAMPTGKMYIFAVQAKDEAGAVSSVFDARTNVRTFITMVPTGPRLNIREPYLGLFPFLGVDMYAQRAEVPPGFEVKFHWSGSADHYGAVVSSYRYGWDIIDLDDPADWAVKPDPRVVEAQPISFYSGIHTLYVECTDNLGVKTLGIVELHVIPVLMQRDLLWVDDFPSRNFQQVDYAYPTEKEHDEFWTNICLRCPEFNPARDIFDVSQNQYDIPPMEEIWKYKNIIWTYSPALDDVSGSVWTRLILFRPDELYPDDANLNYLPFYMAFGGHLWTTGMSQRTGGLAAVLPWTTRKYPCILKTGAVPHPVPPEYNDIGVKCMAYKDFCVTVLDKIEAPLYPDLPFDRDIALDAIRYCYKEKKDPYTTGLPGLPSKLVLWDKVTQPGMFFDPNVRGFHYAEIYDPQYWMNYKGLSSQDCIHPIFRMRAMIRRSVLDDQVVGFWTTKYAGIVPPVDGTVAAPSVQIGMPLFYFNRAQVDSLADAIFSVWQIN